MTNRYSVCLRGDIWPMQLSIFTERTGATISMSSGGCEMTSDLTCDEGQDLESVSMCRSWIDLCGLNKPMCCWFAAGRNQIS